MEMTLDEYLKEVDRWKLAVSDRMAGLSPAERAREDQVALDWLESQLGRRLERAPGPGSEGAPTSFRSKPRADD
jgi:hypothetical protein